MTTDSDLSPRSRAVLEAIKDAVATQGYAPTVREIAAMVGVSSPSTVLLQLDVLAEAGYIRRGPGSARAIVVLDRGPAS